MKAVKVICNPQAIKALADPVRREILRQLRDKAMTLTQLAGKLNITKPTVKHHLQSLREARLIRVAHTKVESHGILQKFYEPTASLFIEDFDKTPSHFQKYFLHLHIEQLRGVLSAFQLLRTKQEGPINITSDQLKNLAEGFARQLARVGKRHEETGGDMNREMLLITIYSEALTEIRNESKWKDFLNLVVPTGILMNPK